MTKKYFVQFSIFVIFLFLVACDNDEQCRKDNYVMMKIGFYKSVINSSNRQTNSENELIVTVNGVGCDSLLYNGIQTQFINLPLNMFDSVSSFDIIMNDTLETFTIWHTNYKEYLSFECGYLTVFKIDSCQIRGFYVDSISFINNSVNAQNVENFRFYHHYDNRR